MAERTIIEQLAITLGVDVDQDSFRRAVRSYASLHFALRDVLGTARAVGRALLEPLRSTVEVGNEAVLTAQRLGLGVEALQELRAAADLTGVSAQALTQSVEKLGRSAYQALVQPRGAAAKAFANLGVSIFDEHGKLKDNAKLFDQVTDKLSRVQNSALRAGLAFALMGRGAGQILPLLSQGPGYLQALNEEVRQTGTIMGKEAAESARYLAFWFRILQLHGEGVERQLGQRLMPIALRVVGTLLALKKANQGVIDTAIDKVAEKTTKAVYVLLHAGAGLWHVVDRLAQSFGGWEVVLTAVAGLAGAGLLSAFGSLTLATLKFAASLALAGIGPAIFGALVALVAILYEDLTSADGAVDKLLRRGEKAGDSALVRFFVKLARVAEDAKLAVQGISQAFEKGELLRTAFGLEAAPAPKFNPTAVGPFAPTDFDITRPLRGKLHEIFGAPPGPVFNPGSVGTGTISVDVDVHQEFNGPTDPRAQEKAADDAFLRVVDPALQRALERAQRRAAGARSGAR